VRPLDPIVRWLARLPLPIQTKLLTALGVLAALLIALGVIGLVVLGQANARAERLVDLQRKTSSYSDLRLETTAQQYALAKALTAPEPRIVEAAVRQLASTGYAVERLHFVSTEEGDRDLVSRVAKAYADFSAATTRVLDLLNAGRIPDAQRAGADQVTPLADRLDVLTAELVNRAAAEVAQGVADTQDAYVRSQVIVLAFAGTSLVLALVLGLVAALSIIGPLRLISARVERIAQGDFTGHVRVENRDELGTLAGNVDRMSDQLGQLYEQLAAANQHKSEFLSSMSHELRTPLNAIIGFSEVLLQRIFGDLNAKQTDYLQDILSSGRHQLTLVNDILDLSKVEAGRMELELSSFSLRTVIDSGVTMLGERATRRGIALEVEGDPSVDTIEADERKVKQVLFNLLSNAVKFTPEGGTVTVRTRAAPAAVEVSVCDTGVGIAPEDQARIFEAFGQAKSAESAKTTEASTGLGLTLAKRFVELHGGALSVRSAIGAGSTFTFSLPRRHAATANSLTS
jgi:signal transduction histidine kinase